MAIESEDDGLVEVVESGPNAGLGKAISGMPNPVVPPPWARPTHSPARYPQGKPIDVKELKGLFPHAYAVVPEPLVAPDSMFEFEGQLPSELWRRFVADLEREQYRLEQTGQAWPGVGPGNLITSSHLDGTSAVTDVPCKRCRSTTELIGDFGECFFGCEVPS